MKLKIGINNVSNEEYHGDCEFLSSSNLKMLIKNRKQFYEEKILGIKKEKKENPAFTEGSYTHSLILEPHLIEEEYAIFPEFRKSGSKWVEFLEAEQSGLNRTILSNPQKMRCERYYKAFLENPIASEFIKGGISEHTICTILEDVKVKARMDYINVEKGYIADIKTSGYSIDRDSFKTTVEEWGYELSAALYCKIAEAYYNKPFEFYFIVIAKKEKHCEIFKLSEKSRREGNLKITEALRIFKECKESGNWDWQSPADKYANSFDDYEILEV